MSNTPFKKDDYVNFKSDTRQICRVEKVIPPGEAIRNEQPNTTGVTLYRLVGATAFLYGIHFLVRDNEIEKYNL